MIKRAVMIIELCFKNLGLCAASKYLLLLACLMPRIREYFLFKEEVTLGANTLN